MCGAFPHMMTARVINPVGLCISMATGRKCNNKRHCQCGFTKGVKHNMDTPVSRDTLRLQYYFRSILINQSFLSAQSVQYH
jgi:hypothetical protein